MYLTVKKCLPNALRSIRKTYSFEIHMQTQFVINNNDRNFKFCGLTASFSAIGSEDYGQIQSVYGWDFYLSLLSQRRNEPIPGLLFNTLGTASSPASSSHLLLPVISTCQTSFTRLRYYVLPSHLPSGLHENNEFKKTIALLS